MPEETVAEIQEQAPETKQEHHADQTTISEYLESLLVTVILALFGTSFIVQAFKIPSASMEGTLLIGDHLLVNKFIFGGTGAWYEKVLPYRQLERGDIIVFKYPYADHQHFVKRVIGLPGDHLKLVDQEMFINGKPLPEPYVVHDASAPYDPLNYNFPPLRSQLITSAMQPEWEHEMRQYTRGDEIVIGSHVVEFQLDEGFLQTGMLVEPIGAASRIGTDKAKLANFQVVDAEFGRDSNAPVHRLEGRVPMK